MELMSETNSLSCLRAVIKTNCELHTGNAGKTSNYLQIMFETSAQELVKLRFNWNKPHPNPKRLRRNLGGSHSARICRCLLEQYSFSKL